MLAENFKLRKNKIKSFNYPLQLGQTTTQVLRSVGVGHSSLQSRAVASFHKLECSSLLIVII